MATSMAFCKDGSPVQALLAALRRLLVCSCGLPVQVDNDERLYLNMCLNLSCVLRNIYIYIYIYKYIVLPYRPAIA